MNPSTACATELVAALAAQGVTDAVVCPGSRSAALAYAFQVADRAGEVRLHVRVDERSAGFLALGLAKLSRRPVAVVTTSGTALANLHPAVLEAAHGSVPMVVLSADRPPELRGTGANQTTDQVHFFGTAVRWSHDLGTPAEGDDPRVWRAVAARACAAASGLLGSAPGPVHLNLPMREPLVPGPSVDPATAFSASPASRPVVLPSSVVLSSSLDERQGPVIGDEPRTLMVLGDLPEPEQASRAVELAKARGWPVVGEPFGCFDRRHVVPRGSLVLTAGDWLEAHRPARVVVVGRPTLSRAVSSLLRDARTSVDLVTTHADWADPGHVARAVYPWASIEASLARNTRPPVDDPGAEATARAWVAAWREAGEALEAVGDDASLCHQSTVSSWPSGLAVARTLVDQMPAGAALFVGSSNPVRDLDLAMGRSLRANITVVGNRGLAGIDGCVSSAVGVALSRAGRPTYALMGDLTFLHDANGLLVGPGEPRPDLTIVVANDDGGGIFTLLEPGDPARSADFERIFGTPTGTSLRALCEAHGVAHTLAETKEALAAAVCRPPEGTSVVEVPLDRASHRKAHRALRAAAARVLS